MGKVISMMSDDEEFLAVCPVCGYEAWEIILDSPIDYKKIKTIRCANRECGYEVEADIRVELLTIKSSEDNG